MGRRKLTEAEKELTRSVVTDGPWAWLTMPTKASYREDWCYRQEETKTAGKWWMLNESKSNKFTQYSTSLVSGKRNTNNITQIAKSIKQGSTVLQIGSYNGFDTFSYCLYARSVTLLDLNPELNAFSITQIRKKLAKENIDLISLVAKDTNILALSKTVETMINEVDYDVVCIDAKEYFEIIKILCNTVKQITVCCHKKEDVGTIDQLLAPLGYRKVALQTDARKTAKNPHAVLLYDYVTWKRL